MIAHWFFFAYFTNPWFILDFVVVFLAISEELYRRLHEPDVVSSNITILRVLRLMRLLRIFRIMNNANVLQILAALQASVRPVITSMAMVCVLTCIYAILGVNLFSNQPYGQEKYGTFSVSFTTLMGIATGHDSWTTEIRSLMEQQDSPAYLIISTYFISFILIIHLVGMNVMMAVLMDCFMSAMENAEEVKRVASEVAVLNQTSELLDGLISTLAKFRSTEHLISQIDVVFRLCDIDDNLALDLEQFRVGMLRLQYSPPIVVSLDVWDDFTMHGALLQETGVMTREDFQKAICYQLLRYSQRLMAAKMDLSNPGSCEVDPQFLALKMILMDRDLTESLQRTGTDACDSRASHLRQAAGVCHCYKIGDIRREGATAHTSSMPQEEMLNGMQEKIAAMMNQMQEFSAMMNQMQEELSMSHRKSASRVRFCGNDTRGPSQVRKMITELEAKQVEEDLCPAVATVKTHTQADKANQVCFGEGVHDSMDDFSTEDERADLLSVEDLLYASDEGRVLMEMNNQQNILQRSLLQAHDLSPMFDMMAFTDRCIGTRCGLRWRKHGVQRPAKGLELTCPGLTKALLHKTEFTEQEWAGFGICVRVGNEDFIKSGGFYYAPADTPVIDSKGLLEILKCVDARAGEIESSAIYSSLGVPFNSNLSLAQLQMAWDIMRSCGEMQA